MEMIIFATFAAVVAAGLYFVVGLIPGTDETASIAPVLLVLVLVNVPAPVLLAFFMAAIASMETSNAIPSSIALVPGSTMAVPFLESCSAIRRMGIPHVALRKMLAASVVGTLVALPLALLFGAGLQGLGPVMREWAPWVFLGGALLIARFSEGRWAAVFVVLPFALFVGASQQLSNHIAGRSLFITFFMGIALGPMLIDTLSITSPRVAAGLRTRERTTVSIAPEDPAGSQWRNPLQVLGRRQGVLAASFGVLTSLPFMLSPVGMTVLTGELVGRWKGSAVKRLLDKLLVMDAVTNSTYIAETIIPLVAIGLPLSPMALGPAAPLFNAPPRFTTQPIHNLHSLMTPGQIGGYSFLGVVIGLGLAYYFGVTRARSWCMLTMRSVSMEALVATFVGLAAVLSFNEAGMVGLLAATATAILSGLLYRYLDVHLGVMYMAFYAAPAVTDKILPFTVHFFTHAG